ncbi:hypothetical protein NST41_29360 [Paenibacillus sp. FSL L8-0696]|uniref:hypothetical protein n=1 Tax=Paenibacillus sp. FSL L8-0696 TaxID=2954524 RepID=UPI003119BF9D
MFIALMRIRRDSARNALGTYAYPVGTAPGNVLGTYAYPAGAAPCNIYDSCLYLLLGSARMSKRSRRDKRSERRSH